ncbi:MAG: ABC transporter ATP-binding protein [Caldilineae bacterium]|nr:MAG: ABC transporter ATP-binding protein [Caldilineae bacterium]
MSDDVILRMENMVKTFPGVVANAGINLEVRRGEIHCLLGENGAGKTVLMSTLYGLYHADAGSIIYKGQPVQIRSPKDAIRQRIGMVHQHFMLVPTLTVAENLILGQYRYWQRLSQMERAKAEIRRLGEEFGLRIDPDAVVGRLSVGEQQRVEILKALYHGIDLLILDEPTAVLTPQETSQLLGFLRELADKGLTIIFITHKLEEVMQVSDRVTVLRDGKDVATLNTAETSPRELARLMVGRDVLMEMPERQGEPGEVVLAVQDLCVENERGLRVVDGVSFEVREREIVGIAGVAGNGQSELALALAGLMPIHSGEVRLNGQVLREWTPRQVSQLGLAHVPEDRHGMAIILPFSVSNNFVIHSFGDEPFSRHGFLNFSRIREYAQRLVREYDVRLVSVDDPISSLSGGNQQKVVVARELNREPRLLLVNQPTRGIDIGATEFVRQRILAQRDRGSAVLLISTELEEIFHLSDRILVMYEGKIVGEVPPDRSLLDKIGLMMAGHRAEA